jgi:hypothetical protein
MHTTTSHALPMGAGGMRLSVFLALAGSRLFYRGSVLVLAITDSLVTDCSPSDVSCVVWCGVVWCGVVCDGVMVWCGGVVWRGVV